MFFSLADEIYSSGLTLLHATFPVMSTMSYRNMLMMILCVYIYI
jgi:hypothetical protein